MFIKEVVATRACHQGATIAVTSYKIILKFLLKSGMQEQSGLGIAAGWGNLQRGAGRRENGQRTSPTREGLAFSAGRRDGATGTVGVREGLGWDR